MQHFNDERSTDEIPVTPINEAGEVEARLTECEATLFMALSHAPGLIHKWDRYNVMADSQPVHLSIPLGALRRVARYLSTMTPDEVNRVLAHIHNGKDK